MTCQAAGILSNVLTSAIFTLQPCGTPPGVRIQLLQTGGAALVDQVVTSRTVITRTVSFATATITVSVNSTTNSVGISVNHSMINEYLYVDDAYMKL